MGSESIDTVSATYIVDTTRIGETPNDCFPIDSGDVPMPAEMDATIGQVLNQNFVNFNRRMDEQAQRHNSTAEFVNVQTQLGFMLQQQLVGAKAAGQLDRDSLAKSRLDAAAVGVPATVK